MASETGRDRGMEGEEAYWQNTLAGCEADLFPPLPPAVQRPVVSATLEHVSPLLPQNSLHKTTSTTASTLIRATWAIIASRYTTSQDVVFGANGTGQNNVVGLMDARPTAIVPLRILVEEAQKVHDFLAAIQRQATEMVPYEGTSLQQIACLSDNACHACRFQTLLVIQPAGEQLYLQNSTTYALTLTCTLTPEGLRIIASFDLRIVESWLVEKLLGQIDHVMHQLAATGEDTALGDIEMLTPADHTELWNWNCDSPAPVERCLHELFVEHALARTEAPAICAWDGELTYGQLDALSTRLAHHLVQLGVIPEMVVPLYFEKSMWTTVAILGVLKAGGAFLLLDPLLPTARLAMLCRKIHATIGVASRTCRDLFQDLQVVSVCVVVDNESLDQLPRCTEMPDVAVNPHHAAYVVFTSGSTGEPKGCKMDHRSSSSAIIAHSPEVGQNSDTRTLQFAAYSFAGALAETLFSLLSGGCLCVPSEQERREGIEHAIEKMNATWAFLTSTVLGTISISSVPNLRTICVGGEPIRSSQIDQWAPLVHLRQSYGATETAGIVGSAKLDANASTRDVGKAATGRYWIVGPGNCNRLAPLGAIGEILVEGYVVGREYIDEPKGTAAAFIQPPCWRARFGEANEEVMRFYKTGDLGRYQGDGSLQLIGRKDRQVKLRGQRIELGEIEHQSRLAGGAVEEIVVELINPCDSEMPMLACFLVVDDDMEKEQSQQADPCEAKVDNDDGGNDNDNDIVISPVVQVAVQSIRSRLEISLPQYMVPSLFVPLRKLPMTSSRKTDRRQLQLMGAQLTAKKMAALRMKMNMTSQGEDRSDESPCTGPERRLRHLWANVLSVPEETIGRTDSFFSLGGDSIVALRLVGAARLAGVGLTVGDVLRNSKLRDQAKVVASSTPVDKLPPVAPFALLSSDQKDHLLRQLDVPTDSVLDILPPTSWQDDWVSVITSYHPSHSVHYSWLDLNPQMDLANVELTCRALCDHFSILRSSFVRLQERWWQIVQRPDHDHFPFRTVELRGDFEAEFQALCERDTERLKVDKCPTGFVLARHESGRSRIAMRLSHAQYDGTSTPTLWQTFADLYHRKTPSPGLAFSSYLAYSESIRHSSESYWRQLLQGSQLTAAFPKPTNPFHVRVKLSSSAPRLSGDITMASLLSAAWAMLLSQLTEHTDVVFGHVVAGRNAKLVGIERLCAPCLNIIPVRLHIPAGQRPSQLLHATHEQFVSLGEADSLGWKEIFKNCTDWPLGSRYNSVIQHQNLEERPEFELDGSRNRLGWVENPHGFRKPPALHMITYANRNPWDSPDAPGATGSHGSLTFVLTSNIASMTETRMEALLRQLIPIVQLIADDYRKQSEGE